MRAQPTRIARLFLIAGLMMMTGVSAPVWAQGYLGVTGGFYEPEDEELDRTEVFGVRGGYRFNPSFGFEASLSRVDLADALSFEDDPSIPELDVDFQLDLYNLDLSLQWFPGGRVVVFAGPGLARIDAEVEVSFLGERFSESTSENILTAHVGLGYEWQINDRFFIRPEARARRYFDDEPDQEDLGGEDDLSVAYEATDYEVAITFGWRIGS